MTKQLEALSDEEAATLLTRDRDIAREWHKWQAMTGNNGSLIVIDMDRVRKVLEPGEASEDEIGGVA